MNMLLTVILVALLVIILLFILFMWENPKVFYYDYLNSESTQIGDFESDDFVRSDRYIQLYSDKELTKNVGYFFKRGTYTRVNDDTLYSLSAIINLNTGQFMKLNAWARYSGFQRIPDIVKITPFVTASNMGHLNRAVSIVGEGDVYKMTVP